MNAVMKSPEEADYGPIGELGLTGKQLDFVKNIVSGTKPAKAAALAGYSYPDQSANRLMRVPSIQEAIRRESGRMLLAEGIPNALAFMVKAPLNDKLPGAVRFQAAKWVLENAGHGLAAQRAALGLPDTDKALSEMSIAELDAFLSAGMGAVAHLKDQQMRTIDGTARNIEPDGEGVVSQVIDVVSE